MLLPTATVTVPVSSPAHPSHAVWLKILLTVLQAATDIGPAVVQVVDPKDAAIAKAAGQAAADLEKLAT